MRPRHALAAVAACAVLAAPTVGAEPAWAEVAIALDPGDAVHATGADMPEVAGVQCRGGQIVVDPGGVPGFRFWERQSQNGCGLSRFDLPVPARASSLSVWFYADREIQRGSSPVHLAPDFIQEVWIAPGGLPDGFEGSQETARLAYFAGAEEKRGMQRLAFQTPLAGQDAVSVAWYWHDVGTSTAAGPLAANTLVQAGGTVQGAVANFAIPLESSSDLDRVLLHVPAEVVRRGGTLHWDMPQGITPQDLEARGLRVDAVTLRSEAHAHGIVYSVSVLPSPGASEPGTLRIATGAQGAESLAAGLPWWAASLSFPFFAGAAATGAHVMVARRGRALGEPVRYRAWMTAGTAAAGVAIAAALFAGGLTSMRDAPASPTSLSLHLTLGVFSLALLVLAGVHLDDRRRLRERLHARQVEAYAARLEQSNRDLEQFAYVASHDLQAPLRQVIGFAELAVREAGEKLPPRSRAFLEHATSSATHMRALIEDLLAFSRIGKDEPARRWVALATLAQRVQRDLGATWSDAELRVEEGPRLWGNPGQLEQLLANLVENASKYRAEGRPCRITLRTMERGDHHVLEVEDNGIGIPVEAQGRIFEVFQRLHGDSVPGTGIGLAICKRIVQAHGGRIEVESAPGVGTTMRVFLARRRG